MGKIYGRRRDRRGGFDLERERENLERDTGRRIQR